MNSTQTLVPVSSNGNGNGNANGHAIVKVSTKSSSSAAGNTGARTPLSDEVVAEILRGRGLRVWLRVGRVARVLGLFSLYLFLDTYDVRAIFNQRMAERLREESKTTNRTGRLKARYRSFLLLATDRAIRVLRYVVFRGHEGSHNKAARLEQQALWLSKSLIGLGPTFIKIGQSLGTRADLLPLAYVKELATLQDQVPAFSTADALRALNPAGSNPAGVLCGNRQRAGGLGFAGPGLPRSFVLGRGGGS